MIDQRLTVLLVEDNPGDAPLIRESLTDLTGNTFDLETTDRLASALRRLSAGGVDAILLDLALPDSDGTETFTKARAQAPTVPIIVLTGLGDEALALKMVQEGAQDYVTKVDLKGSVLSRAIRYAIEREKSEQQIRVFNEQLEERVRMRTAELEAANQELEAFSSSVSHDLRGPLHLIDGFSTILEETHGHLLSAQGKKYLKHIHLGVHQMSGIIEDLLNLSRLGRQQLKMQPTRLDEIVRSVQQECVPEPQGKKIHWRIGPLPAVEGDRGLLKQAFVNLIGNAVKYSGHRDLPEIEIGNVSVDGEQAIFVRDNGAGFDMQHAGNLFSPFQRLHSQEEFKGTGVGLATVRRIIQRHGGRIWAEAQVDKGATFYFTLAAKG